MKKDREIVNKIRGILREEPAEVLEEEYPTEALPLGTYVRPKEYNRLGVITDAYYDGSDIDGQPIITYVLLLLPQPFLSPSAPDYQMNSQLCMSNQYEYDITAYLMIKPMDISNLSITLNGGVF